MPEPKRELVAITTTIYTYMEPGEELLRDQATLFLRALKEAQNGTRASGQTKLAILARPPRGIRGVP